MIWRELVRLALLGSERGDLSPALQEELAAYGVDPELPPSQLLLEGAAVVHQLAKGAGALETFSGTLPEPLAATAEEKVVGPQSAYHLQLILEGRYLPALEEFVTCLAGREKVLPPASLPALLDRCCEDPLLWQSLQPIIGETGRWLISLSGPWRTLLPNPDPQRWTRGRRAERLALLETLRATNPGEARELLHGHWEELGYRDRAALLAALRIGLSTGDEDFLNSCLSDSRKEVRRAAAGLLLLLPDSDLSRRLGAWASAYIKLEAGGLKIDLPAEPAAEFVDFGLQEGASAGRQVSLRTSWLSQVLAGLAPQLWEKYLTLTPLQILQEAARHDQGAVLVRAWMEATLRHDDHRWMGALLAIWREEKMDNFWQDKTGRQLMERMPDQLVNRFVVNQLERTGPLVEENSLAGQLLLTSNHWWSDRLALIVIKGFQNWLSETSTYSWSIWHYKQLLQVAAFRCDPKLITALRKDWNTQSPLWSRWEEEVERFLDILQFRKEMREKIMKE